MSPILVTGTVIVHLALLAYTVWIVLEQRSHRVSARALGFLTTGVVFDIVATTCMVLGSRRGFTLHALLGFSALAAMLVDATLAWRHRLGAADGVVGTALHNYSRIAYGWWVVAYVTGAALVMAAR